MYRNNIVVAKFFILFSIDAVDIKVFRLNLNEKKHNDRMTLYKFGNICLAIIAHIDIVKSNLSTDLRYLFNLNLHNVISINDIFITSDRSK